MSHNTYCFLREVHQRSAVERVSLTAPPEQSGRRIQSDQKISRNYTEAIEVAFVLCCHFWSHPLYCSCWSYLWSIVHIHCHSYCYVLLCMSVGLPSQPIINSCHFFLLDAIDCFPALRMKAVSWYRIHTDHIHAVVVSHSGAWACDVKSFDCLLGPQPGNGLHIVRPECYWQLIKRELLYISLAVL